MKNKGEIISQVRSRNVRDTLMGNKLTPRRKKVGNWFTEEILVVEEFETNHAPVCINPKITYMYYNDLHNQ